jgi:MFS family permease
MNLDMADSLARYGGLAAAVIGLLWMIWQMSGKGEGTPADEEEGRRQMKFLGYCWALFALPAIAAIGAMALSPARTGTRGVIASLLTGCFLPLFIVSLESQAIKKRHPSGTFSLSRFASLPLAGLGISLFVIGTLAGIYGIGADSLWLSFIIGSGLGLFIIRLSCGRPAHPAMENLAGKMESIFLLVNSTLVATIMASHHFTKIKLNAFLPLFLLMGIFLALLVTAAFVSVKPGKKTMDLLPGSLALFLAIFLGVSLFLVMRMKLEIAYNYPIIAGAIIAVAYVVVLYGSATSVKGIDLSAGALSCLLLVGGMWFSFKWGLGLGVSLFCLGMLSVTSVLLPYSGLEPLLKNREKDLLVEGDSPAPPTPEGENGEDGGEDRPWAGIFQRAVTHCGFFLLLAGLFRVLIQKTDLLTQGADIAFGDTPVALFLGVLISLSFEGFNLTTDSLHHPGRELCLKDGMLRFLFAMIAVVGVVLSIGIFYRLEGLAAFVLGLSIPALIGVFSFFSQKSDNGLFRSSLSTLWIAAAAYTNFLYAYRDVPDQLTRLSKQQITVGMILLIMVIYFLAHYQNRGACEKPSIR